MPVRSLLLLLLIALPLTAAAASLSGSAEIASDRSVRGLVQNHALSLGAGLDAGFDAVGGLRPYAGASVANDRMAGGSEVDVYLGATHAARFDGSVPLTLDGGVVGYVFPQDRDGLRHRDLDSVEAYGSASLGPATLGLWLAPDYFGSHAPGGYVRGRLRWPLSSAWRAEGTLGLAIGPGVQRYTAALTRDRRGRAYADASLALDWALRENLYLRGALEAVSLDLGEQAPGGRDRLRGLVGLRWDFGLADG